MELNIAIFSLFLSASFLLALAADNGEREAYIVYMGIALESKTLAVKQHHSLLSEIIQDEEVARQSRIYSYGKSFNAFAAYLLPDEAERLQDNENVVSVFPSTTRQLYTTKSWDFIGMPLSVQRNSQIESDIIVGIMDTGIYMDSPSFNDKGFGPPPSKWKGTCAEVKGNFSGCNNKVIGARAYNLENVNDPNLSPVDLIGHGTHTASTVAGVPVEGASLYGLGQGTARGGVPSSRIAVYKVCHPDGCADSDVLAAFDDAIDDGVDILSLSLGSPSLSLFNDVIAIGSFHAIKKGIFTSAAAGNYGPAMKTLTNGAPWILTVGASSTDRVFMTRVILGNQTEILGTSLNTFNLTNEMYPLTRGHGGSGVIISKSDCSEENLDKENVKGKIVFCDYGVYFGPVLKKMGGIGAIAVRRDNLSGGYPHMIPAATVDRETGEGIRNYIDSNKDPRAVIFKSIETQDLSAPFVASFSSRGPDVGVPSILKPDIVAPGVEILAAYTKLSSVTGSDLDDRFSDYAFNSGTSMACPHASAAAAYVKSFHPDWSPSAIKSALMTTASEIKIGDGDDESAEYAYGAGLINPQKAVQPGLVYELEEIDYIRFLCNQDYTEVELRKFTDEAVNCSSIPKFGGQDDLNYPSMVVMQNNLKSNISAVFDRTVKNVGDANATYKVNVMAPPYVEIKVTPATLVFTQVNEKKGYTVEVRGPPLTVLSASLEWTDSVHRVKSPIAMYFPSQ